MFACFPLINNLLPKPRRVKDLQNTGYSNQLKPELTNIWDFEKCDNRFGFDYPGRIPGQIIWNLMYYFTKENDIFVDPMAGAGTSIDVGRFLKRKVIAFDLSPSRPEILQNDITNGIPLGNNSVDFIFLDPPYWDMKKGKYTNYKTDLSMLNLEEFYQKIDKIAQGGFRVLKPGGNIALIISSRKIGNRYIDLPFECFAIMKQYFKPVERIMVPYHNATSTCSKDWMPICTKYKFMLRAYRDLFIMQKV